MTHMNQQANEFRKPITSIVQANSDMDSLLPSTASTSPPSLHSPPQNMAETIENMLSFANTPQLHYNPQQLSIVDENGMVQMLGPHHFPSNSSYFMPSTILNQPYYPTYESENSESLPREQVERERLYVHEDRRQKRLQRNRVAAKECRKKKKAYMEGIEEQIKALMDLNDILIKENTELKERLIVCRCVDVESIQTIAH